MSRFMGDDGGPAFPFPVLHGSNAPTGMALRDYFAAKAMQGFITKSPLCGAIHEPDEVCPKLARYARISYQMADAMLEARGAA